MYYRPCIVESFARGIDVSFCQGLIDWRRVFKEAGPGTTHNLQFVSVRAGESVWRDGDGQFERNVKGAADAGFELIDIYHAFHPSATDPSVQADFFLGQIAKVGGLGSLWSVSHDFEVCDIAKVAGYADLVHSRALAFHNYVENALGARMKLYTGSWFGDEFILPGSPLASRPLWLAAYPNAVSAKGASNVGWPTVPRAWRLLPTPAIARTPADYRPDWSWWQWGGDNSGAIPGIPTGENIDHDVFCSGSLEELRASFASRKPAPAQPVVEIAPGADVNPFPLNADRE